MNTPITQEIVISIIGSSCSLIELRVIKEDNLLFSYNNISSARELQKRIILTLKLTFHLQVQRPMFHPIRCFTSLHLT